MKVGVRECGCVVYVLVREDVLCVTVCVRERDCECRGVVYRESGGMWV